jgi:hypothetical protein
VLSKRLIACLDVRNGTVTIRASVVGDERRLTPSLVSTSTAYRNRPPMNSARVISGPDGPMTGARM